MQHSATQTAVAGDGLRGAWLFVAALAMAATASYTDRYVLNVLAIAVQHDLGLSDRQFGFLIGPAFALAIVAAVIPLGRAADLLPRKPMLLAALALWSLASVAGAFAPNFAMLALCRLLVGLGEAAIVPIAYSLLGDLLPAHHRGRAVGMLTAGVMLGSSAGYVLGGSLLDLASRGAFAGWPVIGELEPWRAVLVIVTAPNILLGLLLASFTEPTRGRWESVPASTRWSDVVAALRSDSRLLLPLYLTPAIVAVADYAMFAWAPVMAMRRFGLTAAEAGTLVGVLALAATVSATLGAGALGDRAYQRHRADWLPLYGAAAATLLIGVALVLPTAQQGVFFAAFALGGFATITAQTIAIIMLQQRLTSATRGVGSAALALLMAGFGLGLGPMLPPAFATLWDGIAAIAYGVGATATLGGMCALGLFIYLWRAAAARSP